MAPKVASARRGAGSALLALALPVAALSQVAGEPGISTRSALPGDVVTVTGTAASPEGQPVVTVVVEWDGTPVAKCAAPKDCPKSPGSNEFLVSFQVPFNALAGEHRVALCVGTCKPFTKVWTFTVRPPPPLAITDVVPQRTPAGGLVRVAGTTGRCDRATLALRAPAAVLLEVAGDTDHGFLANLTVPRGIFPGVYPLELRSSCPTVDDARVERGLEVVNHAPTPVDDTAATRPGQAVDVPVLANDTDPDGDDGYRTILDVQEAPAHGTAEVQPEGTIRYRPEQGFTGQERFTYQLCEVVGADEVLACGAAAVTVAVEIPVPPTSAPAASTPPTSSGGPGPVPTTSGAGPAGTTVVPGCQPTAGDVRALQVTPSSGAPGAPVRVTATLDRRFAECALRFLLDGSRLGRDAVVGSQGRLAQRGTVAATARPGTSSVALVTTTGQLVTQVPFQVLDAEPARSAAPPDRRWLLGLLAALIGAPLLALGQLERTRRQRSWAREHLRVEARPGQARTTVEEVPGASPTHEVRLQAHPDDGVQTIQEATV